MRLSETMILGEYFGWDEQLLNVFKSFSKSLVKENHGLHTEAPLHKFLSSFLENFLLVVMRTYIHNYMRFKKAAANIYITLWMHL